jgi:hypothetical protein
MSNPDAVFTSLMLGRVGLLVVHLRLCAVARATDQGLHVGSRDYAVRCPGKRNAR